MPPRARPLAVKPSPPLSSPSASPPPHGTMETTTPATTPAKGRRSRSAKNDKMHKRSRNGCYTCRLRRKKCSEVRPECHACRHLGLTCEYKRPAWWSNAELRKDHKENVKKLIKTTKPHEKPRLASPPADEGLHHLHDARDLQSPPELCHSSMPTTASDACTDPLTRHSPFSSPYFAFAGTHPDYFNSTPMPPPTWTPAHYQGPHFSPYEVDVKTECQMFVNDVPMRKDSTIATFSTFYPPPSHPPTAGLAAPTPPGSARFPPESWVHREYFEHKSEAFADASHPTSIARARAHAHTHSRAAIAANQQAIIQVDDCDRPLLDHFFQNVLPLVFPVLEANCGGSARTNVILPALEVNRCYLHCCLSAAALHLKATQGIESGAIDEDIMRHRGATISTLCEALAADTDHPSMLEATLAMIFFQSSVGAADDGLPDIPWHQHFQAAADLVTRLDLTSRVGLPHTAIAPADVSGSDSLSETRPSAPHQAPPFDMSLTAWIDILGATMLGRVPLFAHDYRDKGLATGASFGLAELMGCDDHVMFIISEIACLEAIKQDGTDDLTICNMIKTLGEQLSLHDPGVAALADPCGGPDRRGTLRPEQLRVNLTAVFRLAARVYLCSLVPNFDRYNANVVTLVDALTDAMRFVPAGPDGFDRALVWPLLVAGSVSVEGSSFRTMLEQRAADLGEAGACGSFGRVVEILHDVWAVHADWLAQGEKGSVHWRDVMLQKGWQFLLI